MMASTARICGGFLSRLRPELAGQPARKPV
jgi:hypothetical protein